MNYYHKVPICNKVPIRSNINQKDLICSQNYQFVKIQHKIIKILSYIIQNTLKVKYLFGYHTHLRFMAY